LKTFQTLQTHQRVLRGQVTSRTMTGTWATAATGDGAQRLSHTDRWLKAPPVSLAPLFMRGQLEGLAPSVLSEVANVLGSRQRGWQTALLQDLGVVPFMLGARSCFATCA
jgi:hypothetical protein